MFASKPIALKQGAKHQRSNTMTNITTYLQAQSYANELALAHIFHPGQVTKAMVEQAQAKADALYAARGGAL